MSNRCESCDEFHPELDLYRNGGYTDDYEYTLLVARQQISRCISLTQQNKMKKLSKEELAIIKERHWDETVVFDEMPAGPETSANDDRAALLAHIKIVEAERNNAYALGGREGWMRCGVFHIDINFEANEEEQKNIDNRWPLGTEAKPAPEVESLWGAWLPEMTEAMNQADPTPQEKEILKLAEKIKTEHNQRLIVVQNRFNKQ